MKSTRKGGKGNRRNKRTRRNLRKMRGGAVENYTVNPGNLQGDVIKISDSSKPGDAHYYIIKDSALRRGMKFANIIADIVGDGSSLTQAELDRAIAALNMPAGSESASPPFAPLPPPAASVVSGSEGSASVPEGSASVSEGSASVSGVLPVSGSEVASVAPGSESGSESGSGN